MQAYTIRDPICGTGGFVFARRVSSTHDKGVNEHKHRIRLQTRAEGTTHRENHLAAWHAETGYSRSTIYLRISQGLFIKPVALGARAVGFPAGEVAALNAARIAGKTDADIRALVTMLETARQAGA